MKAEPAPGMEQGLAWFGAILSEFWEETILPLLKVFWEWATTPLGAAVTISIIGVIIVLRRVFKG